MYKEMYLVLFNAVTDALRLLEEGNIWTAKKILVDAQRTAEEAYIAHGGDEDVCKIVEIFVENVKNSEQ